jgi:ubiquinone/menaquinone biosynthesis C-methylase UbiE
VAKGVRQYEELAKYYDLLYGWKDYGKEGKTLAALIQRYKASAGSALLDVGCGTGKHIEQLRGRFDCVGMDSSEAMLQVARKNVKGVEFVQGDMTDFDLGRKFDVILCLFSAIGFVRTNPRLARTLRNFSQHLKGGGVVIIEPWFTKETVEKEHVSVLTQGSDVLKIVRVDHSQVKDGLSVIDERIVVAEKGVGIRSYRDRMVLALFERNEFLKQMRQVGLQARYLKKSLAQGRGLYVGTLPKE